MLSTLSSVVNSISCPPFTNEFESHPKEIVPILTTFAKLLCSPLQVWLLLNRRRTIPVTRAIVSQGLPCLGIQHVVIASCLQESHGMHL